MITRRSPLLDIGSLRNKVTIQAASTTQDEAGQPLDTWTDILTAWAAIDVASAREVDQHQMITSQQVHLIKIRWTATTIAPGMRVNHGSRNYFIQAVEDVMSLRKILKLTVLAINESSAA